MPGSEGKMPGLDKGFDDPGGRPGPILRPLPQGARPFILSTPHHSTAWQGGEQAEGLSRWRPHCRNRAGDRRDEAEMAQLDADYRQMLAEYEGYGGGG